MSVSVSQSGNDVDLNAIVSGGEQFMARLKAMQEAKAQHDEALKSLALGTDVVRAMQDVQAREQAAMDAMTDAKAKADQTIFAANDEAERIVREAKDKAVDIIAKAQAKADALVAEVTEAHAALGAWSDRVKADVVKIKDVRQAFASLHDKIVTLTAGY